MAISYRIKAHEPRERTDFGTTESLVLDLANLIRGGDAGSSTNALIARRFEPGGTERLEESLGPAMRLAQCALGCTLSAVSVQGTDRPQIVLTLPCQTEASNQQQLVSERTVAEVASWVMETGQSLMVNDRGDLPVSFRGIEDDGTEQCRLLSAPVTASTGRLGAFIVGRPASSSRFSGADLTTLEAIVDMTAAALDNLCLHEEISEGYRGTIKALAGAIDAKDPYTCGHSRRVSDYALMAADAMAMKAEARDTLEYAASLHDIGKIGVDDAILRKPQRLRPEERASIESHPVIGAAIVRSIPFLRHTESLILYHHERIDGKGYPHRLAGEEIPLGARIISVADAFDTMTTERPYHHPKTINEAMMELQRCSGTQFCPVALDAFAVGFAMAYRSR